jgi:nitroreductase
MNDKIALFLGRRSIRAYEKREVAGDLVRALLEAAMSAPSCCETDPWRFVVVRSKPMLKELAKGLPYGKMLAKAGVGIAVCGDLEAAHDRQLSYLLQDCSAAIENLLLAAHAVGLGACWLGVHPRQPRMDHLTRVLGLPASVVPVACIAIGYPAETAKPRTRYDQRYVHEDKW